MKMTRRVVSIQTCDSDDPEHTTRCVSLAVGCDIVKHGQDRMCKNIPNLCSFLGRFIEATSFAIAFSMSPSSSSSLREPSA